MDKSTSNEALTARRDGDRVVILMVDDLHLPEGEDMLTLSLEEAHTLMLALRRVLRK